MRALVCELRIDYGIVDDEIAGVLEDLRAYPVAAEVYASQGEPQ